MKPIAKWIFTWAAAVLFVLGTITAADALDPFRLNSQYARERWGGERGFPGGAVAAFAQTPDGYLWIGTEKGLIRFDGLEFRVFESAFPGMPQMGPVQSLLTDADGNLWVLLQSTRILRYRDGKFEPGRDKAEFGITAMGRERNGSMVFSSLAYGTLTYRGGTFEPLPSLRETLPKTPHDEIGGVHDDLSARLTWAPHFTEHSLAEPASAVVAMAESVDGKVWLGTQDSGLFQITEGKVSALARLDGMITCLLPLNDGKLWIGTENGVTAWNGVGLSQADVPSSLRRSKIFSIIQDRDSNIWAATSHGLLGFHSNGASFAARETGAIAGPVTALFEDREGNLWVGGSRSIERLRDSVFITYPVGSLQTESSGPIFVDGEGRAWFAPFEGGLHWAKDGKEEIVTQDGLAQDVIYSIAGGKDELWIGRRRGGLTHLRYADGKIMTKTYMQANGLAENSVYAVYRDRNGAIWAATVNAGISEYRKGHFTRYSKANGMASDTVFSIEESPDGTMWFATANGLNAFSKGQWRVYTTRDGLPSDIVSCLLADSSGILWIGTGSGLAYLRSGHIQKISNIASPLQEEILGLAADNIGGLWIATSNHILSVKRERLLSNTMTVSDLRDYGLEDGLAGTQGMKRFRSVVTDAQGRVWFSTNRGFSVVDPSRAEHQSASIVVQIEAFSADGNPVDLHPPIRVPPDTHRLTFSYSGISLSDPERIQFRYKLDGFDKDWSEPGSSRSAVYTNVNWGSYTFRVMASNRAGVSSNKTAELPLSVAPTLYQTRAFRILLAASSLLGIWALHRRRVHQIKGQEKHLRDVVETIPAMTFTALSDGSRIFVNKGWTEYTGLSVEQSSGTGWQRAIQREDLARHSEKWRISVATGQLFEDEARYRRAADGGYRWFLVRGVPLRNRHGKIVRWYGTLTDIEDRKRAEDHLRDTRIKLTRASQIATVAELSASIAHELNQPLMSVLANAQAGKRWLAANPPNLPETKASIERIIRDARAADQVMQHIRGLFKQESFKKKQVSIRDVLSEAVRFLHGDPRKPDVSVDWQLDEHLPTVSIDLTQIQQVFINLISNAMEALEGSTISPHIIVRASTTDQHQMLVQVIDNGPGVADQERIFDAFVTTKKNGMGIGLAVSRSIVEAHGGRLWAENNPGSGATFSVTLPLSSGQSNSTSSYSGHTDSSSRGIVGAPIP